MVKRLTGIYAVATGEQYGNPHLSVFRPLPGETHSCSNPDCGTKFDFEDLSGRCGLTLKHICCCRACIDAVMSPEDWGPRYVAPAPVVKEESAVVDPLDPPYVPGDIHPVTGKPRVKPAFCPVCNGPSQRGNGFAHKNDCSERPEAKAAARRAELEATRAAMPVRPNCPSCDGPPSKGMGWQHKSGCKDSVAGKLAAKKAEADARRVARGSCPVCGGPAGKIRGFVHTDACTAGKVVKQPVVVVSQPVVKKVVEKKKIESIKKDMAVLMETVAPVVVAAAGRCPKCNGVADDSEPSGYRHKRDSCTETRKV